ncbi:carbohydrate ABC transporter permease [Fundicoccus sp. Sow4_H7]|uniref:carbohydrate ABC transporter permease n=1 Tax=Fundicoccus sp. Sow4_H7 TaxID=3438784 RepID=UPI003F8DBEE0
MKSKRNYHWGYLFLLMPIILQLIFFFVPLFQGAYYSLTDWSGLTREWNFIGFGNFTRAFSDPRFRNSLSFTALYTIILIVGEIVIGIAGALLLNSKIPSRSFFRTTYFFPAVLSTVTVGLIFSQIFNYGIPQIGRLLNIEFLQQNLLANINTAPFAVAFVGLWQGVAMPIIIFLGGLQSIPQEIIEAAQIDGANKWETFRHIMLPHLAPSISIVFILALKAGVTAFDSIMALTGGGPQNVTMSLGLLVYNAAFSNNDVGYANAIAMILFVIILVISLLQMYLSSKSVSK